ncbi:MAG: thioredoxin family protein [archaeon]
MESVGKYAMKLGEKAKAFSLPGTDGKQHSLADFRKELLVIFFSCNHCPYAQAYEQRVMRLQKEFSAKVDFIAINSNDDEKYPEDGFAQMKERAAALQYNFMYLRDAMQAVAKMYGGECTPHFFVFDKERKLRYQGRCDNNWKDEKAVTQHELNDAIVALLAGKPVLTPITNALGCSIKWKE